MVRQVTKECIAYLTEREGGMRLDVHDDGYGFPTVGVGHLVMDEDTLKLGDCITLERGQALLQDDLMEARFAVSQHVKVVLTNWEFDALVCFTFNVGATALRKSSLVRRINAGQPKCQVAREEMPRWNKSAGRFSRGLQNRRIDTAQMFCHGDYTVDWSGLPGQI